MRRALSITVLVAALGVGLAACKPQPSPPTPPQGFDTCAAPSIPTMQTWWGSSPFTSVGIYVGGGWMIHSSGQGVAVTPLTGWYRQQFAWARRPLSEAGLQATK